MTPLETPELRGFSLRRLQQAELRLADGSIVKLDHRDAERLYDQLRLLAGDVPGALLAAAKVRQARRSGRLRTDRLDERESDAIRRALTSVTRR
jgi:hypothetical protein